MVFWSSTRVILSRVKNQSDEKKSRYLNINNIYWDSTGSLHGKCHDSSILTTTTTLVAGAAPCAPESLADPCTYSALRGLFVSLMGLQQWK